MVRFGQKNNLDVTLYPDDRVFVMHDLEHTPQGTNVKEWPRHCTTLYPFYPTEAFSLEALAEATKETLQSFRKLNAQHAETVYFGANNDIPVALLGSQGTTFHGERVASGALELLHRRLMVAMLGQMSFNLSEAQFFGYAPHITLDSDSTQLDPFAIDALSIAVKDGQTGKKHIAAVINRD